VVSKRLHRRHSLHLRSNRRLRSRSSPNSVAAADVNLSVEVHGDDIVVTLPGTSYVVTYYRAAAFPQQLLTKSHSGREDEGAPMTQAEFHARAWKAAQGASIGVDRVKKCGVEGNRMQDLHIEVRVQDIVVTMPGTTLRVVYRKPHRGSQLVARLDYFQDQQKGPITRAEFLTRALKAANDKARELGWLVLD
jgi:hypothetical protein